MGLNTAMLVLNDHLHIIERDMTFGAKVSNAIRDAHRDGGGRDLHQSFGVLPSGHADYDQVVVIGGNRIRRFEECQEAEAEAILRRLADRLGFTLRRKPNP